MVMKYLSGNEAVAQAALAAGAKVIAGYPGTPSSEAIGSIWNKDIAGVHVEWSTNEKVALEIAGAASWANQRALCTMKMSGLNVAYDSLISFVYSGGLGGFVIYVCDDPGVAAGMPEQDVRGFAFMSDMPVLEPCSVAESYSMTLYAFELSEAIGGPVMLRSVTNVAQSHAIVDIPAKRPIAERPLLLEKDIAKYTKAGAIICMNQHRDLIKRLEAAEEKIGADGLHQLKLGKKEGLGIISVGVINSFIEEAMGLAANQGIDTKDFSFLRLAGSNPLPKKEISKLIEHCGALVVLEENEDYIERCAYLEAYKAAKIMPITGKQNGVLSRIGNFNAVTILKALYQAVDQELPPQFISYEGAEALCAARPIGVCAGCPHRGVYIGINQAVRKLGYKKDEVMVTGDIGCTILGMSPPFHTLWTEIAMGASIPMALGYHYAGIKTPVIATIGDSTFMHGGMPGLLNAVQNQVDITVVIMDNGWTAMTGMQVNAGTDLAFQQSNSTKQADIAKIVQGLGVTQLFIVDPYDLPLMTQTLINAIPLAGIKVILARRECAIQTGRRKIRYGKSIVLEDKCTKCKVCINTTGCPSIVFDGERVFVDAGQCNGCGICNSLCKFGALVKEG
ncbi:MAG: indolepyruvate ferredoxin oxidoreductase subunit alpha [Firmicutes bacterium]|nr:indolepyruvate ferredoxin oxidoreductase subunit alpha [Bacillota bacterium]